MRPIDADALKEDIVDYTGGGIADMIRAWIDEQPTVDAAPVVHGRWIKLAEAPEWDQRRCTVCGDVSCCQRNYCPNCGAKMDGDGDER